MAVQENKKLDNNGFHCDDCTNICLSNKNPKYHPDSEYKYKERMNSKY